ncbi:MAG TPA: urease accessory protein UreD [Aromatoleum sp.]|uniref:urease accessory protein UreD n=1 Tax=Aromatoleum sp. TaxID=2307007 RepID=UPI002B4892CB|nr:urease accessory protein UreD [Aromatoleum sp.]HJV28348.1 urease accessory protein UreD [Aromatoleum sp.]
MNAALDAPFSAESAIPAKPSVPGWCAQLQLGFERRDARTVLVRRHHFGPLRLQKALYPEGEGVCHGIVLHPPAGIAGGDSLEIDVSVGAGAHALLTTPGAGKWYRSAGAPARLMQRIAVREGGVCEWLPQESIVFDGALGRLETEVELVGDACFVGAEMLCFGRTGSGERFARGELRLATRIDRDGKPLWLERGCIAGGSDLLDSPVGLAGQPVVGSLLVASPKCEAALRDRCRDIVPVVGQGAVTLLPGLLVARWLGPACEPGREWFVRLWDAIRPAVVGLPMRVPRIWNT